MTRAVVRGTVTVACWALGFVIGCGILAFMVLWDLFDR